MTKLNIVSDSDLPEWDGSIADILGNGKEVSFEFEFTPAEWFDESCITLHDNHPYDLSEVGPGSRLEIIYNDDEHTHIEAIVTRIEENKIYFVMPEKINAP